MIGVQAVSGGLVGMLVLGAIGLAGLSLSGVGLNLALRGRKLLGALSACAGVATLAAIAVTALRAFPEPLASHVVDLQPAFRAALREAPARCAQVGTEEWCSVEQRVRSLMLLLPDGQRRTFGARSLYAVFSDGNLKKVAFLVDPHLEQVQLAELLTVETKALARSESSSHTANDVLRRVSVNELVRSDQHAVFEHPAYRVHVWLRSRSSQQDPYRVWYEITSSTPGAALSFDEQGSNKSVNADAPTAGFAPLRVAGYLQR